MGKKKGKGGGGNNPAPGNQDGQQPSGSQKPQEQGSTPSHAQGLGQRQGQNPAHTQGQNPGQGQSQNPGQGRGQNPPHRQGQNPGQGQSQNPGQGRGQNPPHRQGQNPGQGQSQNPGQGRGQNPGQAQGQNPGQGQSQNPGQGQGQNPGQGQGQNPAWGRGQNVGWGRGQNPGQGQGQNPAWGRGQVPGQGRGRGQPGQLWGQAPGFPQTPSQSVFQGGPPGFSSAPRPSSPAASVSSKSPAQGHPPESGPMVQPPAQPAVHGPPRGQSPAQPSSASALPAQSLSGNAPVTPRNVQGSAAKSTQIVALPQRANCPNEPKVGRPIPLEVNHLLLKMNDPGVKLFHYDVMIDPDKPKRFMRLVMDEVQKKCYPRNFPGFDGSKNLYSRGLLPIGNGISEEVNVADDERHDNKPKTFRVTIKLARSNISLQELFAYQKNGRSTNIPQDVIQALDVILRSASAQSFVQVGRSFFCPPNQPLDLGNGMELWYGFYQSFVMGSRPYLNIDVAHKGFPTAQSLLKLLAALDPNAKSPMDALRYRRTEFEKFIRGLKITYQVPGIETSKRTYRVNGLVKSAIDHRFDFNGRSITIGEYFEKEKNYRVRWPELPCIHVGHREKDTVVPLELCVLVPGQATQKKLDDVQTAKMVRIAATNVMDRKNKIREAMQRANINASPHVKELGLSVATEFAKINGRILPAPKLAYYQNRIVQPAKGVWRMDNLQFRETRELHKWICLVISNIRPDDIRSFTNNLRSEAQRVNMAMAPPDPPIFMDSRDQRKIMQDLNYRLKQLREQGYQLVLVVINDRNKQIYGQVKQVAELQVGVLTQCVKDFTVSRKNNQATVHNIMLKINAKFNGVNQVIDDSSKVKCFNNRVLVFGADVTHPSPDSKDIPSVAAVTASHDLKGFKYNMRIRLQAPRQEMIEEMGEIVYEQIAIYSKETGGLPHHIVFYRDGVSEGQFQQVLSQELSAIFKACARHKCRPKVTFLVVQKRHHTRFFPTNPRDSNDKNGNVPAGTIVDMEITHPNEIDFYLVSHASIQGVARPTKYHVLWDDANMSENDIQLMTYNLCHLFTRCDRAVSYPAPTYYAHLAASRGRVYLEGKTLKITDKTDWAKEGKIIQTALNFTNTSPMYFV